jgi:hypothetical protein
MSSVCSHAASSNGGHTSVCHTYAHAQSPIFDLIWTLRIPVYTSTRHYSTFIIDAIRIIIKTTSISKQHIVCRASQTEYGIPVM